MSFKADMLRIAVAGTAWVLLVACSIGLVIRSMVPFQGTTVTLALSFVLCGLLAIGAIRFLLSLAEHASTVVDYDGVRWLRLNAFARPAWHEIGWDDAETFTCSKDGFSLTRRQVRISVNFHLFGGAPRVAGFVRERIGERIEKASPREPG